jgi:hypothetical protein
MAAAGLAGAMPGAERIEVAARPSLDGWLAEVALRDGARTRRYHVRVAEVAWRRLTGGRVPVEDLVVASFEFLLEREPPSAILEAFEITVIPRYFPEYEGSMRSRFGA